MSRTAGAADVPALVAIEQACFGTGAWSEAVVAAEVAGDRHVVLVDDDLMAYAAGSVAGDVADLDRVAVLPSARGQGRARALVGELVDRVRDLGAGRMLLEVAVDNAAAVGLYESCGFDTISTRRGYYPGGIDALVMELTIEEWR